MRAQSVFFLQTQGRIFGSSLLAAALALGTPTLQAQEKSIASLKEFISTEVRQQGFTLAKAMKVHVYAKGGGSDRGWNQDRELFAYGWILNAATREVVWQMSGNNSRKEGPYRVADTYIELPPGSYEAYFSNHAFGRDTVLSNWNRNIDRRLLNKEGKHHGEDSRGFLSLFGADGASQVRFWKERAQNYGLELSAPSAEIVATFSAPLRWKNILVSLTNPKESELREHRFQAKKPITLHIYALGEGSREGRMHDYGWITDAKTLKRVWEMTWEGSKYAGGAEKNRRQVETIQLPAGEYIASYGTDDSHTPVDWNAAPPCDPLMYGLTLAIPSESDFSQVNLIESKNRGHVLAELIRAKDEQSYRASFTLESDQPVRVFAIGEGLNGRMADYAWIEDARNGQRVWTMERDATHHAGGALKNRMVETVLNLGKGSYTLHFKTDDSHAYGDWNADAPWDPEHYGVTVYGRQ